MQLFKTSVLVISLVALAGCSSWDNRAIFCGGPNPEFKFWPCGEGPPDKVSSAKPAREDPEEKERQRLAAELAAAQNEIQSLGLRLSTVKGLLADRDKELAGLRGEHSAEMAKLKETQRGLVRALRPQIEKGDITVDLNNERLMINLASSYLFGSGQDELKPAGADALKQVGAVLKDFPEYKVAVDGHTDNVPIQGALKKKFPTNKELSEARAANGLTALAEGGVSAGTITSAGYADTRPVAPNATDEGRQKNRRVEVRVTPKS